MMKPIQRRLIVYGLAATIAASSIAPAFAFSRKHPMAERPMNPPAPKAKQEQKTDDARNYSGYARYDYLLKQAQLKKQQEEARKQKAAKQQKHAKAPKPAKKQKTSLPAPVAVPIPAPQPQAADVTAVSETARKEAKARAEREIARAEQERATREAEQKAEAQRKIDERWQQKELAAAQKKARKQQARVASAQKAKKKGRKEYWYEGPHRKGDLFYYATKALGKTIQFVSGMSEKNSMDLAGGIVMGCFYIGIVIILLMLLPSTI